MLSARSASSSMQWCWSAHRRSTCAPLTASPPFTTDADIVLDPSLLTDQPALGDVMRNAGFVLTAEPGIWEARFRRFGFDDEVVVPVDLIVPMQFAAGSGRRSARLGGEHGKHSARKSEGLEGALVDHTPIQINAIDPADPRSVVVNVAGEAAMLVAKLHKLGDRLEKPERLDAKDAGDVYRLFDIVAPDEMASRLAVLRRDPRSAGATTKAIAYGTVVSRTRRAPACGWASRRCAQPSPEATTAAVLTGYWRALRASG